MTAGGRMPPAAPFFRVPTALRIHEGTETQEVRK